MQPSAYEIEREVETLRDIRRRSSQPGLVIDPDLPAQTASAGHSGTSPIMGGVANGVIDPGLLHPEEADPDAILASPGDDPSNLFWLPARLHPEIAPSEFKAFLKEHARVADGTTPPSGPLSRANSSASSGLGRKRSMLHKEYDPSSSRSSDSEEVLPIRRNRTSMYQNVPQLTISDLQKLEELAEEASLSDDPTKLRSMLRRSMSLSMSPSVIDQMDDLGPIKEDDNAPILVPPPGQILRRSARTKIRKAGQTIEGAHRFKSTRGSRAAKIAAHNASGGGFGDEPPLPHPRDSLSSSGDHSASDHMSTSDHDHEADLAHTIESYLSDTSDATMSRPPTELFENTNFNRPQSYSEETSIYESYARDDDDHDDMHPHDEKHEHEHEHKDILPPTLVTPANEIQFEPEPDLQFQYEADPQLYHPQPQRLAPPQAESPVGSRTPSPEAPSIASSIDSHSHGASTARPGMSTQTSSMSVPQQSSYQQSTPQPPQPSSSSSSIKSPPPGKSKEKEKKSGFFKFGKSSKDKKSEKEKEKDSGFLGGLFGGGKKKAEEPPSMGTHAQGREAAAALLGASKARAYTPTPSPGPAGGATITPNGNYARYPIHVERAIYRLSHIKLANPRRPLYEQVLISNLMFWYLGIINKAQAQTQAQSQLAQNQAAAAANGSANGANGNEGEGEGHSEHDEAQDHREREEREKAAEREREAEYQRQQQQQQQQESRREPRRGALTKAPPAGTPPTRNAEMPVRGPQYERQHQAIENEYGGGAASPGAGPRRSGGAPPQSPTAGHRSGGQAPRSTHSGPPPLQQPSHHNQQYFQGGGPPRPQSAPLPPGAMAPVGPGGNGADQSWMAQQQNQYLASAPQPQPNRSRTSSSPSVPRSSNSPPPRSSMGSPPRFDPSMGGKTPGRSLSATALATNGGHGGHGGGGYAGKGRSISATAVAPKGASRPGSAGAGAGAGTSPEEDVPLAMWQQQQQQQRRR